MRFYLGEKYLELFYFLVILVIYNNAPGRPMIRVCSLILLIVGKSEAANAKMQQHLLLQFISYVQVLYSTAGPIKMGAVCSYVSLSVAHGHSASLSRPDRRTGGRKNRRIRRQIDSPSQTVQSDVFVERI